MKKIKEQVRRPTKADFRILQEKFEDVGRLLSQIMGKISKAVDFVEVIGGYFKEGLRDELGAFNKEIRDVQNYLDSLKKVLSRMEKQILVGEISTTAALPFPPVKYAFDGLPTEDIEKYGLQKVEKSYRHTLKMTEALLREGRQRKEEETSGEAFPKQKISRSIVDIRNEVLRLERLVERALKLKREHKVSVGEYWKIARRAMEQIGEKLHRINLKIRGFSE